MARPRLSHGPPRGQFGFDPATNQHVEALRLAMLNRASQVARMTNISPRTLQHYIGTEHHQEGPGERLSRITRCLMQLGSPHVLLPLRVLADEVDHDLVPRNGTALSSTTEGACAEAMAEVGDAISRALGATDPTGPGGHSVTDDEATEILLEIDEAITALHLLRRQIQAESGSNVTPIRRKA